MKPSFLFSMLLGPVVLVSCVSTDVSKLPAEKKPDASISRYHVYTGDKDKPGNGYTKLQEFVDPKSGRQVCLIGMVHVGDASFYRQVQQEMDKADIVLTEGVGSKLDDPLLALQMQYLFSVVDRVRLQAGLHSQHMLTARDNWINADLSMDEMFGGELLADRYGVALPAVLGSVFIEPSFLVIDLYRGGVAVCRGRHGLRDADAGARQFLFSHLDEKEADNDSAFDKPKDRIILAKRNLRVMEVLEKETQKPGVRRIVIPWGAEHGPELERMLVAKGYVKKECRWLQVCAVRDLLQDDRVEPSSSVRIPYVFSYGRSDSSRSCSIACSLLDWHNGERDWKLELGYGLGLDIWSGRSSGGVSLLPSFFDHGLLMAGRTKEEGAGLALAGPLLSCWSAPEATRFGLQPLFYNNSTADGNALTLSPLMTRIVHDPSGTRCEFDPNKLWPVFYRDDEKKTCQVLWPLVTAESLPEGRGGGLGTLGGWLTDSRWTATSRYDSMLKGVVFEKKTDEDLRYFRILNLYSRRTSKEAQEYSVLWPLCGGSADNHGIKHDFFLLYHYSQELKDGKPGNKEFGILPAVVLPFYLLWEEKKVGGDSKVYCLGGFLYQAHEEVVRSEKKEQGVAEGEQKVSSKAAGEDVKEKKDKVVSLENPSSPPSPAGSAVEKKKKDKGILLGLWGAEADEEAGVSRKIVLYGLLYYARQDGLPSKINASKTRFLCGSMGLDQEGRRRRAIFLWMPVWSWKVEPEGGIKNE